MIERKRFTNYGGNEKSESRVYTVRLNSTDRANIQDCMRLLRQSKRGTTMKSLMRIGMQSVLHDEKTRALLGIVTNNLRKNEKLGLPDSEIDNKQL